jgi:hypothetical protein
MRHRGKSVQILVIAAVVLAATVAASPADVTINQTTKFDGFGERGWLGSEGSSVMIISGDRARIESTSKPTGKLMKHFAGEDGARSAMITRLDRKVMYAVDFKDKSYQEIPFDFFKQNQQAMMDAMSQAQAEKSQAQAGQQQPPPLECDPIKFDVKNSGEKQSVNGFDATHVVITGNQPCHNTQTKQTCNMVYTADDWFAPMTAALKDVRAFALKQAAAMGIDPADAQKFAQAAKGLLSQNTEGLEAVGKELARIDGYPVRTRLTIEKGGDCGTMDSSGGGGESQSPGAAMKGAFKGLFGKKKSDSSPDSSSDSKKGSGDSAGGLKKIFGTSSEVTSVTNSGAPANAFEPPDGFKKKDLPKIEKPSRS